MTGLLDFRRNHEFQMSMTAWADTVIAAMLPGAHLLSFGGTRTHHRMMCAIEDAGFEIRDTLMWLYGSGFPKSLDVGKAIDKAAGAEREVVGNYAVTRNLSRNGRSGDEAISPVPVTGITLDITAPATDAARQWDGWGTALKPAWEPIIMARKPFPGTVASNVLAHGTGAINVDACRIGLNGDYKSKPNGRPSLTGLGDNYDPSSANQADTVGRWPANVILDEEAAAMLDAQSGDRQAGARPAKRGAGTAGYHGWPNGTNDGERIDMGSGGASRFFYVPKASRAERNAGLDGMEERKPHPDEPNGRTWDIPGSHSTPRANHHPTVKPVKLMEWLITLVTPPGGTVLDPFGGSGSTGVACANLGIPCILIEMEEEYCEIAARRIDHAITLRLDAEAKMRNMPTQLPLTGDD